MDVAEALHKSQLHTYQINRDGVCSGTELRLSAESHRSDPHRWLRPWRSGENCMCLV